jgi:lipoprotein-anchoring transpeptidase ErfK/SrfK
MDRTFPRPGSDRPSTLARRTLLAGRAARGRASLAALLLVIAGCTSSGPSLDGPGPETVAAAPTDVSSPTGVSAATTAVLGTTPSGRPAPTDATAAPAPADTTPQTQVDEAIIATPDEALSIPAPTTPVSLADDYTPSPDGVAVVLEAITSSVRIYKSATSREVLTELAHPLPSGAPLTFLVDGQTSTRYKVLLPIRPNGSTGWIDPVQVKKFQHDYRIVVELSAHRLTAYNGSEIILSDKIGVGKDETPSPSGRYYIKELLKACENQLGPDGKITCVPNPDGAYGPYAYGLSGFSPVLKEFKGNEPVIGIHGTNQPELLGQDVSSGCIRMNNDSITALAKVLPLGTPVIVRP